MLDLTATQYTASIDRPVALRMRPDLIIRERKTGDKTYFIIKDPIRLTHHQLWEEEFELLRMLNGRASVAEMKEAFSTRFKGSKLDLRILQLLHGQFHRNGLVVSDGRGQADELQRRNKRLQSQMRWGRVRHLLCIRFRGINPDGALEELNRRFGWCFDRTPLLLISCFLLVTFLFFAVQSASSLASVPSIDEYFTPQTLLFAYLSFIALKLIHEIGHGLACKHYGGECNEMGLMLLVFTPCLYCDVTDSWMVESKWRRAMIGFAGVWFELIAASICMWIWWFSNPGMIHSLCFHVMLVGSLCTLFFNGNPLLKYDAYFVVSDLLDRPNLYQQAWKVVSNRFARIYMRKVPLALPDHSGRSSGYLGIYGLLAIAYRWFLGLAILWIAYTLLDSLRLEWVGIALVLLAFLTFLYQGLKIISTFAMSSQRIGNLRKGRVFISGLIALALGIAVVGAPIPARLRCPALLEVKDAKPVTVMVDGRLQSCVAEGKDVHAGDEIAVLVSKDLELSIAARRGELARQQARLNGLVSLRGDDPTVAARIPTVREAIAGLELEIKRLESDFELLTLRAPVDGRVIAPLAIQPSSSPEEVQVWSGTPLENENLGSVLRRGTTFCVVGDVRSFQATVYLTQGQVELVRPGQEAMIKTVAVSNTSFRGRVVEVGTSSFTEIPEEVAKSGVVPNRVGLRGRPESVEPVFAARVEVSDPLQQSGMLPLHQSLGQVTIQIAPQSLGTRIARFFYSTFAVDPTVQRRTNL